MAVAAGFEAIGAPALPETGGARPLGRDFDGDGRADPAVFEPGSGRWLVFGSRLGLAGSLAVHAAAGGVPAPADYDGDGAVDLAVFRPATAEWFVLGSTAAGWGPSSSRGLSPGHGRLARPRVAFGGAPAGQPGGAAGVRSADRR